MNKKENSIQKDGERIQKEGGLKRERQTVLGRDEEENERVVRRGLGGEKEKHR